MSGTHIKAKSYPSPLESPNQIRDTTQNIQYSSGFRLHTQKDRIFRAEKSQKGAIVVRHWVGLREATATKMPLKVRDGGEALFFTVKDVGEYESNAEEEDVREYADVEDVRSEEQEEEYEGGNGDAEYVEQDVEGNGEKVKDGEEEEDIEYREIDFEQTDEEDDNTFHSLSEGEEAEEEGRKRGLRAPKFKQYNKEHDLLDPKVHMGMEFPTIQDWRRAIRYYSIAYARKIKYLRNEPYMVRLVCDDAPEGNEESIKDLTTTTKDKAEDVTKKR
ncbi:unnamed protein product [Prunus armeniaca]